MHVNDISDLLKIWSFEMKTGFKCLNILFFRRNIPWKWGCTFSNQKTDVFDMSEYVSICSPFMVICNYIKIYQLDKLPQDFGNGNILFCRVTIEDKSSTLTFRVILSIYFPLLFLSFQKRRLKLAQTFSI